MTDPSFIASFLVFGTAVLIIILSSRAAGQRNRQKTVSGKIPNQTNRASRAVQAREEALAEDDELHSRIAVQEKYASRSPNFSFEGRSVVDEFAELRKKNERHERHLQERIK